MKKKNKANWSPALPLIVDPEFRSQINQLGLMIGELPAENQDFSEIYGSYKRIMRQAVLTAIAYEKLKKTLFPE